jgi:hypothetical protein
MSIASTFGNSSLRTPVVDSHNFLEQLADSFVRLAHFPAPEPIQVHSDRQSADPHAAQKNTENFNYCGSSFVVNVRFTRKTATIIRAPIAAIRATTSFSWLLRSSMAASFEPV